MASKVRVYGKAQSWTALGIIDAYLKMYPHATLEDLNKAFPREQLIGNNRFNGMLMDTVDNLQKAAAATEKTFDDDVVEDMIRKEWFVTLQDGTRMGFNNLMWTKESFPKIVEQAKLYDIEIAEFVAAEKGAGKRGEYRLEYLNGYVPPVPEEPKKSKAWLWILIGALVIVGVLLVLLARSCNKEPEVITKEVEKTVIVRDTVYVQEIEEIEKNYNAAEFNAGKADLPEAAKFVLHDLAKVLEKNPEVKLRLEGHTSAEGTEAFNQKLSEQRAQAAVDFLVNQEGVDPSRLEAVGLGATQLKNTEDPKAPENRRTEFIVIE